MSVRVGRHPALRAEVGEARNFERHFALAGLDLNLLPHRLVLEPLGHFQVDFSGRKLHLKRPIHVSKGSVHQLDVGAVILKPLVVDFRAVSVRRNVAALLRSKAPGGRAWAACFQSRARGSEPSGGPCSTISMLPPPSVACNSLPGTTLESSNAYRFPVLESLQGQRGAGAGDDLRIKIAGAWAHLRLFTQSLGGRGQPRFRLEIREEQKCGRPCRGPHSPASGMRLPRQPRAR